MARRGSIGGGIAGLFVLLVVIPYVIVKSCADSVASMRAHAIVLTVSAPPECDETIEYTTYPADTAIEPTHVSITNRGNWRFATNLHAVGVNLSVTLPLECPTPPESVTCEASFDGSSARRIGLPNVGRWGVVRGVVCHAEWSTQYPSPPYIASSDAEIAAQHERWGVGRAEQRWHERRQRLTSEDRAAIAIDLLSGRDAGVVEYTAATPEDQARMLLLEIPDADRRSPGVAHAFHLLHERERRH